MKMLRLGGCFLVVVFATGCVWRWSWQPAEPTRPSNEVEDLLREAERAVDGADTRGGLIDAIAAYERVLEADPRNFTALSWAGNLYILLGDAYTDSKSEKRDAFRRAIALNEGAMRTNQEFSRLLDGGEEVWQACRVLTARELDAMGFWTTGIFYLYKEGQSPLGQMVNFRWMGRALSVLERMQEIDGEWGGGGVPFSLGIYYLGLPESVGGDREKSADFFAEAIEIGPDWIVNRWGRARYYHIKMGNRAEFEQDMRWVLDQDPRAGGNPYPWNVYFQKDAREKLATADELF